MSLPPLKSKIDGGCSAIHDNFLYIYSSDGFQSLELTEGAEWKRLAGGQSVEGGVCVGSNPADGSQAGFFVVGGSTTSTDYGGLQKYTYSTGEWEPIYPATDDIKNRTSHSAAYIKNSDSIVVYSGSTDGSAGPSSQTFTIGLTTPTTINSATQDIIDAGVAPVFLQWNDDQAVMAGGNDYNTKVLLFDTASVPPAWVDPGISLADPVPSVVQGSLFYSQTDSSISLDTFDLTTTPPTVNRVLLLDASGNAVTNSAPLSRRLLTDARFNHLRRQSGAKFAPSTAMTDYSVASAANLAVLSGVSDSDYMSMYDMSKVSWMDPTSMLGTQQSSTKSSSTSSHSSTATSSSMSTTATSSATVTPTQVSGSSSTPTPTPVSGTSSSDSGSGSGMSQTTLLGVVLGTIFGAAILLLLGLFCIKRARRKQRFREQTHARQLSDTLPDEKGMFPQPMERAPAPPSVPAFRGHQPQNSAGSFSSMAILMGKVQKPTGVQRKPSNDSDRSSVSSIFNKQFKRTIGRPQAQESPEPDFMPRQSNNPFFGGGGGGADKVRPRNGPPPDPEDPTRRSSGWNRYWSGGSTLNILGYGGNGEGSNRRPSNGQDPSRRETVTSSYYSDMNRRTQDSATVPPLKVEGRPEFNRVHSSSPRISQNNPFLREGMAGQIESQRPVSAVSAGSAMTGVSAYSSGIPASVQDAWEPQKPQKAWGSDRVPSSNYSGSIYPASQPSNPPMATHSQSPPPGMSRQPQLDTAVTSSDMSWLNLGSENRR